MESTHPSASGWNARADSSGLPWLRHLGLSQKLLLALLLCLAAVAVPLSAQLSLSQSLIQIVHKERAGLQVAGQLMAALHELPKLRPPSQASASAELPRRELLRRLELAREQIALRPELPAQLVASVAELQADVQRQGSAATPVAELLQMQAQLRQMLELVLDHSTLILDPGVDTYYLVTATLQQGVELAVLLQGLEQAPASALIARSLRSIRQSLDKVAASNPDRAAGLTESLTQLEALLLSEEGLAADTGAAAQQQAALAEWLVAAMGQLDRGLEARAKALRNTQLQQLFLLFGFVLAAALLGRQIIREYQARTEEQAHRSKMLDHAEELAKIGCAETDLMSDTVQWTTGMFRLFGEPVSRDLVDPDWLYLRVPRNERELVQRNSQAVTPEQAGEFLHRIQRADGEWRTVVHRAVVDLDSHGWPRRALTILQDVTEQKDAEQRIQLLDNCCPITGLLNRKALLDRLEQVGREQARHELMVLQINQLGMVMDSLGYEGSDRLLQWVAGRLRETAREGSALAHLGQGEFACLLPIAQESDELLLQQAQAQCEQLSQTVQLGEIELNLSCSLGLSCSPQDGAQGQKLLQQAQAAMARARELGENQVSRYDAIAHAKVVSRLSMETALRRALEQGSLHLHFQPQVELRKGLISGAEVLLRWTDPVRGEVPPVEFIPVAEESGLIVELGEWVLRAACVQAVAWQRAGMRPVRLAVNLSARQLQLPDIAWRIQNILRETGMDPCHLGLEITESQFINESPHLVRALASMKAIGVEISLDDFGTGYSNLSYLRRLPIDVVKIDRSVIHDVAAAAHDVSITRAVINMAHSLQLRVLAEGVETEGQLALLMAHGCDEIQGYYFSRALSAEVFEALMRNEKRLPEHLFDSQRKRTLLLVDDEENIVSSLRRLLRRDGYQILTASSGSEGLQLLAGHDIDVIISDQRMPGMTGVEFLRRAKELYPSTVRMVLSGYTELQSITDAINEGAIYKFLTKPWEDERLRAHVQEAFQSKELTDENKRLSGVVTETNKELAQVNRRLQQLLQVQRERISREEVSLQVVRSLLESIPVPIIGGDINGMISYLNEQAEQLFGGQPTLVGRYVTEALTEPLRQLWAAEDGASTQVELAGRRYQALLRNLSGENFPGGERGRLLVLMPIFSEEVAA